MGGHIPVSLFKSVVFLYKVKIVPPDDQSPLHLQLLHHSCEDATSDGHVPREGAFLVYVISLYCLKNGW